LKVCCSCRTISGPFPHSRRRLEDYRSRDAANVSAGGATGWNSTGSRPCAAPKILINLAVSGRLGWKDKERSTVEKLIASGKQFSNQPARPAVSFLKLSFCEIFVT